MNVRYVVKAPVVWQKESEVLSMILKTLRVVISASQMPFSVIPEDSLMTAAINRPKQRLMDNVPIGSGSTLKPILGEVSSCSGELRSYPSDVLVTVVIRVFVSNPIQPVGGLNVHQNDEIKRALCWALERDNADG